MTAGVTTILYSVTSRLFRASLDERLLAVASVASTNFDPRELDLIRGTGSVATLPYRSAVLALQDLRRRVPNVKFAYILRPTADPSVMEFVADADSLDPAAAIDLNRDGAIDDRDALTWPGDAYDAAEYPEFQAAAFVRPFVDPTISTDQWGSVLSGTAPIIDPARRDAAARFVLGIDLGVTDVVALQQKALTPFLLYVAVLIGLLTLLTLRLARSWRRQVAQLAEIDRQKDDLLRMVGHQLASPMTSIKWSLEELVEDEAHEVPASLKPMLQQMHVTSLDLIELVNLLLDVSRIELNRLEVNRSDVALPTFLEELLASARVHAEGKGVKLVSEVANLPATVHIDRRLTRMTLENLLSNAVKYSQPGGAVDFIVHADGGELRIQVSDDGIGIPLSEQPRMFEKMYRASNARAEIDGNGFGLYVAKGAIEQQGGRIWFESAVGQGTTFHVTLPAA